MDLLTRGEWQARSRAHAARVDTWVQPHLERRRSGLRHPVHDFLFTYYSQRPAGLRRWHPGWGVVLLDASEYADQRGYSEISARRPPPTAEPPGPATEPPTEPPGPALSVSVDHLAAQLPVVRSIHRLLVATAGRAPTLGCFGLHEWAMVHGAAAAPDLVRHDWPLRLGPSATDQVVESHRITCSHFDAFRFFAPTARPLNTLQPGREDRADLEQPGCLHAGMDLYKHAFRLTPLVPSELVADCFDLAWDIRELDMRASPYDFSALGFEPVQIETPQGKQEYVVAQRVFAERGAPLRQRLIDACAGLVEAAERDEVW